MKLSDFAHEYVAFKRALGMRFDTEAEMLASFCRHVVARKLKKPIDRLTVTDPSAQVVRLFLTYLEQQRGCSVATRNQRLGGVHALARFIGEHSPEHIEWYGQIRLIPFKKGSQPLITYLDRRKMDALLAAHDKRSAQGRREDGLMLFLYNSGARASEAAQLKIKDIDWHAQCVRVIGKGNKQRHCPLWADTLDQLRVLASERDGSEPVFLNRCDRPMTRSGIHTLVKRCAVRAGNHVPSLKDKKVGPHVIRHSTASHLLQSGVDINTIRAWLGHVSLTTTNVYAEINLETKARALATCAVSATTKARKHWSAQPDLMEFLRKL